MEAMNPVPPSASTPRNLVAGAHQAVDRIAGAASQAAETLSEKRARLSRASRDLAQGCRSYVNENPAATVGVAIAAGFLLRHLIRTR